MRLSITDRCNLRCRYCMPECGVDKLDHNNVLSLEDYISIVKTAVKIGIKKIRITGGEPLVRKNVLYLIESINNIEGIDEVSLTTNGLLFEEMADKLKAAGIRRVNFSLDTLDKDKYAYITRGGDLSKAIDAIKKAMELGFSPIKINTVIIKGFNDDEINALVRLTYDYPLHLRFIEMMPVGNLDFFDKGKVMRIGDIQDIISSNNAIETGISVAGNGPAKYWRVAGSRGSVGFISPISRHFCAKCNRLRVNSEGKVRLCLLNNIEYDLRKPLAAGGDELLDALKMSVLRKPKMLNLDESLSVSGEKQMYKIGG